MSGCPCNSASMNICEQVFMWAYIFQLSRIHLHEKNKMVTVPEAGGGRRLANTLKQHRSERDSLGGDHC